VAETEPLTGNAIVETILADSRATERLDAQLNSLTGRDPNFAASSYRLSKTISARAVRRPKSPPVSLQVDLALSR